MNKKKILFISGIVLLILLSFMCGNTFAKYLTTYAYDTEYTNQKAYNRGRLGDATAEVVLSTGGTGGWYSDYAGLPYSSFAWFHRGGNYNDGSNAGVFSFYGNSGFNDGGDSSRAALVSFAA